MDNNGIEITYTNDSNLSVRVNFISSEIKYPVKLYFTSDSGIIQCESEIGGPGNWYTWPYSRNQDIRVIDNNGDLILNKVWKYSNNSDIVEIEFINWCRDFIFINGRNPNGIVIGSHNGLGGEWVEAYKQELIGNTILIEPNIVPFHQLVSNYQSDNRFTFKQVVVSETNGFVDFYTDDEGISESSSLIQDNILKNHSVSSKKVVKSLTPDDIFNNNIQWLHIDAEGYDARIILLIDDKHVENLRFIIWEHIHLSVEEKESLKLKLESIGFRVVVGKDYNTFAIKDEK
jgi:FkbM family methyltransferase